MLHADIGHVAVVGDMRLLLADADLDAGDIAGPKSMFLHQQLKRIQRRLNRRSDRPLLNMGVHYLEATAKLAHQSICIAAEGFEEAARSGKDVLNPSEAGLHHGRRGDTVARAHASEIEGLFHVVLIARPAGDAGGLLGGVAERPAAPSPARTAAAPAAPNSAAKLCEERCIS